MFPELKDSKKRDCYGYNFMLTCIFVEILSILSDIMAQNQKDFNKQTIFYSSLACLKQNKRECTNRDGH